LKPRDVRRRVLFFFFFLLLLLLLRCQVRRRRSSFIVVAATITVICEEAVVVADDDRAFVAIAAAIRRGRRKILVFAPPLVGVAVVQSDGNVVQGTRGRDLAPPLVGDALRCLGGVACFLSRHASSFLAQRERTCVVSGAFRRVVDDALDLGLGEPVNDRVAAVLDAREAARFRRVEADRTGRHAVRLMQVGPRRINDANVALFRTLN
jgi:hypothetical protein